MADMASYFRLMFGLDGAPLITAETLYYLKSYAVIILAAAAGSTPVMKKLAYKIPKRARYILSNRKKQ